MIVQLFEDISYDKVTDGATRGNVAVLIWNMLKTEMWDITGESEGVIDSKALFGMTFGMAVGFPVGPGSIVGDVRYLNDFSKVISSYMGTTDDCVTRRSLNISLGYQTYF